jgi:hypothetical protein
MQPYSVWKHLLNFSSSRYAGGQLVAVLVSASNSLAVSVPH